MLPLINFLFLSSSPYTIPFHQKLKISDEKGMHGLSMLLVSNFTALTFYSLIYLMVNLVQVEASAITIPLLYQYVLMRTGVAAIPILLLVLLFSCFQLFYDLQMTTEHILMFYRELRYKSYSTRLERLEKVKYLGK